MSDLKLVFGSRGSALARWQTDWVITHLQSHHATLRCETRLYTTTGDRNLTQPLTQIGGKGLFTEELENALRSGEIDAAVHSLKDLPVDDSAGLVLGAICERDDARDVLVAREGWRLKTLPTGAQVGTCSRRRAAQLLAARPDLTILPVRGNVDTRVRKAMNGDFDAIALAAAGVHRLGLSEHISEYLPFDTMLPAPGQAALAVQCRSDDERTLGLLAALDHAPTRAAVTAERTFLSALGGGCSAPVAAFAQHTGPTLTLTGLVANANGSQLIRVVGEDRDPEKLARRLAFEALSHGAGELMK